MTCTARKSSQEASPIPIHIDLMSVRRLAMAKARTSMVVTCM